MAQVKKRQDLVGQTFGQITVLKTLGVAQDFGQKGRAQIILGRCSCGGTWKGRADSLKKGNTKSCGCRPHGQRPESDRWRVALRRVLRNYRRHATRRGFVWGLSRETFFKLTQEPCFYCGAEKSNRCEIPLEGRRKTEASVTYNGIDRKNNSEGYTEANSVPCCATCNYAKRGLSYEDFLALARRICERHQGI